MTNDELGRRIREADALLWCVWFLVTAVLVAATWQTATHAWSPGDLLWLATLGGLAALCYHAAGQIRDDVRHSQALADEASRHNEALARRADRPAGAES